MNWELAEAVTDNGRFEIINNERTYQYARAMGLRGVKAPCCSSIGLLACDEGPYVCDLTTNCNISEEDITEVRCGGAIIPIGPNSPGAPWWSDAEIGSYDFAGFYSMSIDGWDGLAQKEISPNALDGFSFGTTRRDGRSLTFDGLLLAQSEAGLEFGLSYYDSILSNLNKCNLFTMYFASSCPPDDTPDNELGQYLRHLRRVALVSGPTVVDTHKSGSTHMARIQFTVSSESPWIYKEPVYALDDDTFDPETCTCENREILFAQEQEPPIYATRSVLTARKRYPIKIARDGSVCRIGDWDWSQTQFGGGTGIVTLDSYVETQQIDLEAVASETTDLELADRNCPDCEVVLYWDVDGTDPKHMTFENLRWDHEGGPLPCSCNVTVAGYYIRNDSYDPEAEGGTSVSNAPWKFEAASGSDEDCCYIDLAFTSPGSGEWSPLGAALKQPWATGVGRDPYTFEQNFPPVGCGIRVAQRCEDKDFELEPYLNIVTTSYATLDVEGPVTYFTDGSWESADNQAGCLPESFCGAATNATVPNIVNGPDTTLEYYNSPFTKDITYVGVKGPVKYNENGTWVSFDGVEGCLPDSDCIDAQPLIPYLTNSAEIGTCSATTECPISIDTTTDTWTATDWFFDPVLAFPDEDCNYYLSREQSIEKVVVEEEYLTNPGSCGAVDTTGLTQIFPSFETSAWERVLVPKLQNPPRTTKFCSPFERMQKCGVYTNHSSYYDAAGNIEIKIGSKDLKNFRLRAWTSPFDSLATPCDDYKAWIGQEPDFTLEVPHLPSGGTLYIDGEIKKGNLSFPGGRSEAAIRYVTGKDGLPYRNFIIGPCETVYFVAEASCIDTAENMKLSISFSNYYGASGSLIAA